MTNNERLTARLNACKHPRRVYNALLALAPLIREARAEQQRTQLLEVLQEGDKQHDAERRV